MKGRCKLCAQLFSDCANEKVRYNGIVVNHYDSEFYLEFGYRDIPIYYCPICGMELKQNGISKI